MGDRRWTDADLRAAWEDGVRDALAPGGVPRWGTIEASWERSKPRAKIRALEVARAGLPEGGR